MLVARAFVWSVSPRALLAVLALSLSVAYALVSAGSLAGLGSESATIEAAEAEPGWVVHAHGDRFPTNQAPTGAILVHTQMTSGIPLATIVPYPYEERSLLGPYARVPGDADLLDTLDPERSFFEFAPQDHLLVPPETYDAHTEDGRSETLFAYVTGPTAPSTSLATAPWQGVAVFYEAGADQIRQGLVFVVLTSGAIAALLAAGFAHLEVLARRSDLATLEALAGRRIVRQVVAWRVVVLVATGLVLGTLASLAILRIAQVAVGAEAFGLTPTALLATWAATGTGGIGFGILSGRNALRSSSRERLGTKGGLGRRFPAFGPLRFLVVTPRLFAGVFAATLVAGLILSVVIASSAVPTQLFGSTDDETVVTRATGNPLRGTADRFLGTNTQFLDGVADAMPETYAPTTHEGRPLLVKGTDLERWRSYQDPTLIQGDWPDGPKQATLGIRAARLLDLGPGDTLLLPAAYHKGAVPVTLTGIHNTGDFADDELFTDLDTAGELAGLPAHQVTLIRVRLEDPSVPWSSLAPRHGIEVVSLALTPENPPPLTPATVTVELINFADRNDTRNIGIRIDGNITVQDRITLGPQQRSTHTYSILTPQEPAFRLEVNPTRDVTAGTSELRLTAPGRVTPGDPFQVRVRDPQDQPVASAEILIDGEHHTNTQTDGTAQLRIHEAGLYTLTARTPETSGGLQVRIAPLDWSDEPHLVVERLFLDRPRPLNDTHYRVDAAATFANLGGAASNATLTWRVDDANTTRTATIQLASATRTTVEAPFTLAFGTHTIGIGNATQTIAFTARDAARQEDQAPQTVEQVLEEKRRQAEMQAGTRDPTRSFLDKVFESLESAVVLVVVATLIHSGALVWVAVVREVRERQGIVRQLDALGAAAHQVEARALRDTALSTLPAILAGIVLAGALLELGRYFGFPAAFGHALPTADATGVLLRTGLTLLVIALGAAFYAVQSARRHERTRSVETPHKREADWMEALS